MKDQTTIWTLNKAYDLIAGPTRFPVAKTAEEVQAELCAEFNGKIIFGQRDVYGNQLMPDVEYSVPIAPKCIGRYFESENSILGIIEQYYRNVGQLSYTTFWDQSTDGFQMMTSNYEGYYSIIEQSPSSILIGYSQGGLVARYLYWLDRNVFKKNQIRAVITISSPDFGSPLANPENTESIITGLLQIIGCIFGNEPARKKAPLVEKIDHAIIREFVTTVRHRIEQADHCRYLSSEDSVKQRALSGFLRDLYTWLGGLRNDPNNAFYDMNLMRMEPNYSPDAAKYSVLASIHQSIGPSDDIRSIVSANILSKDLLYDAAFMVIIEELEKCLCHNTTLEATFREMNITVGKDRYHRSPEMFDRIDTIYSQTIMTEHPSKTLTNPLVRSVVARHAAGTVTPVLIEPYAHDFIIPSAYQLTCYSDDIVSDKTYINSDANHLSGSELWYVAGGDNKAVAIDFLHQILG